MAKYTRFDPRNKKNGRNKSKVHGNEFKKKIRMAEDNKNVHRYKGTKLEWVVYDETDQDQDTEVS